MYKFNPFSGQFDVTTEQTARTNTVGTLSKATLSATNAGQTINASSVGVYMYSLSGWQGDYGKFTVPAVTELPLTDNSVNYLIVDYNAGSPTYNVTTNPAVINNSNTVIAATVWREGTDVHWVAVDWVFPLAIV